MTFLDDINNRCVIAKNLMRQNKMIVCVLFTGTGRREVVDSLRRDGNGNWRMNCAGVDQCVPSTARFFPFSTARDAYSFLIDAEKAAA